MSKKRKRKSIAGPQSRGSTSKESGTSDRKLPDNFNPDYTYVKKDLRMIGILAGIFITVLVILSFVI